MSDLHTTESVGLINHIQMLDERIGRLEILVEQQGSGSYKYNAPVDWTKTEGAGLTSDTRAAIQQDTQLGGTVIHGAHVPDNAVFYIDQTTDGHFTLSKNGAVIGSFPSRADAEKAEVLARG